MSFFPDLDFAQLLGLAIFGFFTGFGSTLGLELAKYVLEKLKKNKELLKNHLKPSETQPIL